MYLAFSSRQFDLNKIELFFFFYTNLGISFHLFKYTFLLDSHIIDRKSSHIIFVVLCTVIICNRFANFSINSRPQPRIVFKLLWSYLRDTDISGPIQPPTRSHRPTDLSYRKYAAFDLFRDAPVIGRESNRALLDDDEYNIVFCTH